MPAGRAGRGWEGLSRLETVLAGVGLSRADAAGQSTSCPPWAKPGTGAGAGHAAPRKPRACGDDPVTPPQVEAQRTAEPGADGGAH